MSPSRTFILRPVATSLLMAGILLAGAVGYKQLAVSALPEVDYPTIQITTFYPGASPDVMASSVTAPLERQFGQVPGLQQMTSVSSYGLNLEDLRSAIVAANVNQAKGNFDGPHQSYQIGANDQLLSSSDYAPLIIAYRNGSPVKLTDVAGVSDDAENVNQAAWMNSTP